MQRKTKQQCKQERTRRRANIRRGMKIALHEINQVLAPHGAKIEFPPGFIHYTVAIAEGGRRDASTEDRMEALWWHQIMDMRRQLSVLERITRRAFG